MPDPMGCLFWDFDGTLGYREGGWADAIVDVLEREADAVAVDIADVRPYLQDGFPWHAPDDPHTHISTAEEWWAELYPVLAGALKANGAPAADSRELAEQVRTTYVGSGWDAFDDTRPTLATLSSKGWRHVVLSNHVPELEAILRDLELHTFFEDVYTSAEIGYEKPHPAAFRAALDPIDDEAPVWMIGDSLRADVRGANAVGLPGVLVRGSYPDVAHACESLSALEEILPSP